MVRTYKRKSTYCKYSKEHILQAVKAIKVDSKPLTKVAHEYGIKLSSLYYHFNRYKNHNFTAGEEIKEIKNVNQVFTKEKEFELVEQFMEIAECCVGLGPLNIRKFAYEFAVQNELDLRQSWVENEAAGEDWFISFVKRHPIVTDRSNFNPHSNKTFFKNYQELLDKFGFKDSKIYKIDEILLTTAKQPNRVFARRGKKETPQIESMKQDEITTMVTTVSASGSALPPMFIIPRTAFVSDMMDKAMEGSIKVTSKSGWITKKDFIEYLEHFVKVANCDKTNPCLIILDNHASFMSLEAITYAKENGIFMLILPLHSYSKLQPLKDKVFEDLKTKVNDACEKWIAYHSKKTMKVKDIINLVEKIFPNVFTRSAIKLGFELSIIYPLNSGSYSDESIDTKNNIVLYDQEESDENMFIPNNNDKSTGTTENVMVPNKNDDDDDAEQLSMETSPVVKEEHETPSEILPDNNDDYDVDQLAMETRPFVKEEHETPSEVLPDKNDDDDVDQLIMEGQSAVKEEPETPSEILPDKNHDYDVDRFAMEGQPAVKEEHETPSEIVVYYPTDFESSMKMPLSEIAGLVGTTLEIIKESDDTDVEQKENIVDCRINENEEEVDAKVNNEPVEKILTAKNKLDKQDSNESDRKKRRKPKANSKLSDYICY